MRPTVFGLASLSVVTGFCLVQACGGDEETPVTTDPDAGNTSSSGAASSSGATSSSGAASSSGNTSSSGGTGDGGGGDGGGDGGGKSKMTFFYTSTGNGAEGGNLGGLKGADDKCKALATAKGGGDHTWAAYLSTDTENAIDRIGKGPWYNQKGDMVAADLAKLHSDGIKSANILDENGTVCANAHHDILTGSGADGKKANVKEPSCNNWTVKTGNGAIVGHCDWEATSGKWNNAHAVNNCDEATFKGAKGEGRLYCFAKD